MELVTGRAGTPHITSQQDRQRNQGTFGDGAYILKTGNQLAPVVQSSNKIQIKDGALMFQGALFSVKVGTVDEVTIANGSQGMQRKDLIVARYTYDAGENVESAAWAVIQGTPAASNPVTPEYTEGDIQAGDTTVECPVFIVTLDGINITGVEMVPEIAPDVPEIMAQLEELNSKCILDEWQTIVHPYSNINPSNTLKLTIKKNVNGCIAIIEWVGSVNQNVAEFDEITIPEEFRPSVDVYVYTPSVIGTTLYSDTGTRITIKNNGKVGFITNTHDMVERLAVVSY